MKDRITLLSLLTNADKKFAVLIDPDKCSRQGVEKLAAAGNGHVDFFFYGGSLLTGNTHDLFLSVIRKNCSVPVVLFPGNYLQINRNADGILLLSLISGRNPELLIGKHVIAAPYLRASGLEILPTGYMLIESGKPTAVSYMSNSNPIPGDQDGIAACTAMAGEMLGLKIIYLDGGSGALTPVSTRMISHVRKNITLPLIIGGGIQTPDQAAGTARAGANVVVVGNAIENDPSVLMEMSDAIHRIT